MGDNLSFAHCRIYLDKNACAVTILSPRMRSSYRIFENKIRQYPKRIYFAMFLCVSDVYLSLPVIFI